MKKVFNFKKISIYNKQIILIAIFFILLFLIISFDELLDLPNLIFGAQQTPINIVEIVIEITLTLIILLILCLMIKKLHNIQKKNEEELVISRNRLMILNKTIRHDLINDFVVIRSAINIFKETSNVDMLEEIEKRVIKSLETIADYRKYEAFISSNKHLIEIEITDLINEITTQFPNMNFNVEGSCKVIANGTLHSVFTNLTTNSIIHGGSSKIDILITSKAKFCEIRFQDNGKGIPNEIKNKIFDEGFIHGKTGHSGIGLYIVKQTIKRYDGTIYVENNKPKGTTFVINLRKSL